MQPILSCRNILVDFFSGFKAVQGVDLEVQPQEVRFFNWSEWSRKKTTMLDVICGKKRR
ncbi:hypothetical protein GCM10020331_064660 [Ectobacillus funiculus]